MTFETILTPERIEEFTSQGFWPGKTITDYLDHFTEQTPDKIAFVDSRRQVTYAQLKDEVDRFARALLDAGVGAGDVVSSQLPLWIESLVVHYAATRIGAVHNPLIPIYREREVGFMVGLVRSKVIVVPAEWRGFDHVDMVRRLRGDWSGLEQVVVVDGASSDDTVSWEDFTARGARYDVDLSAHRPDPNDVTLAIFTSGTTGEPKGVMHTHNTLAACNQPLPERLGITSDDVFHMASSFGHLTGYLYGARLNVQNGASCVLQDVWDPAHFVSLVAEHGITYTSAATPFLHDFLTAPNLDAHDVSSLRLFCCMGAPIPRVILREAREKVPTLTVLGGWGQTENGLVTLGIPGDPEEKILNTDGYPFPGMRIRTVDAEGNEVAPGEEGRVQVAGPFLFVGYAERLEMTRALFDGDWFDTGDLAKIDADGYIQISGRTKDVIIRGGENIPVAYVENVLYEHPKLEAVAVVGIPDPRLQERACACVRLVPGADVFTFEEMQAHLKDKGVAKQYWPERLVVLDELPTTPSGKIQKFQLRDQVQDRL